MPEENVKNENSSSQPEKNQQTPLPVHDSRVIPNLGFTPTTPAPKPDKPAPNEPPPKK